MRFVKLRAFNATLWGSLSQGKKLYKIISLAVPPSGRQPKFFCSERSERIDITSYQN